MLKYAGVTLDAIDLQLYRFYLCILLTAETLTKKVQNHITIH